MTTELIATIATSCSTVIASLIAWIIQIINNKKKKAEIQALKLDLQEQKLKKMDTLYTICPHCNNTLQLKELVFKEKE